MKKETQRRLSLLVEARKHAAKMQLGSAFVTDFKAMQILNEMIEEMQKMLGENLELQEQLKSEIIFRKSKKDKNK